MDRLDCAYVINSCPAYYYLLVPHLTLLRRYCPDLSWPVYIGSEEPGHEVIKKCVGAGAQIIELDAKDSSFWESRVATVRKLPAHIKYVFPVQEDFLLERYSRHYGEFKKVVEAFDANPRLISARFMPCPGPKSSGTYMKGWNILSEADDYLFTFQATLWKREAYCQYLESIIKIDRELWPSLVVGSLDYNKHAVGMNLAENAGGRNIFKDMFKECINIAWSRSGVQPNAVYDCPFPYRPTAVVKGVLQDWASDLLRREGVYV
jgi:hypothetical protein